MQGLWDEQAERDEAEATALREATLAEAQAAAEAMAGEDDDGAGGEEGDGQAEHDLDDDIPEADGDEEEDEEDQDQEDAEWVDFEGVGDDDGGMLPIHEIDGDFGPDGMRMSIIGDGAGDMMGGDLDGDVPEGGSYQHTDTDVEDSSSSVEDDGGGMRRGRSSIGMASVVGFAGAASSPVQTTRRRQR